PDAAGAKFVLDQAGCGGKKHVGSDRGDDDGVEVRWSQATLGKGFLSGLNGEVARGDPFCNDVAFPNANAGKYPFVSGVDHLFEVGVGENAWRYVGAESADLHSGTDWRGQ